MQQDTSELEKEELLNRIAELEQQLNEEQKRNKLKELKFEKIFNNVADLICLHQPDGTFKKLSPSVKKITGYTPNEMIGKKWVDFIHPEDRESVSSISRSMVFAKSGDIQGVEYRFKHKNGKYIWLTTSTDVITNENGELEQFVTSSVETTSRRKLLDEVRKLNEDLTIEIEKRTNELELINNELEQQFAALNQAAKVSIANAEGNIIFINEKFRNVTGYSEEELIGKNHRILKSGLHNKAFYEDMWSTLLSGNTWSGEICNRKKNGEYYWVYTQIYPFKNIDGEIEKFVSLRFDITDFKEQEKKIRLNASILGKMNNKLSAANAELETFTYSVSHDLKAPLRALQGFSDNLIKKYNSTIDERGQKWLRFISDNAKRMDVLISDLLDHTRIGKSSLVYTKVDMDALVKKVYDRLSGNYKNKVSFNVRHLPEITADNTIMEIVWQNLIENALKYSSKREEIKIDIWAEQTSSEVIYFIADNGIGFNEKNKDKIFGIFKRLHADDEFEGTGIGLANAKRGVSLHGGNISAKGVPNEGATFSFSIPIKNFT